MRGTEARSADQTARSVKKKKKLQRRVKAISPREARKNLYFHFSVVRMGSRGTFVLCTLGSRCTSSNTKIDAAERRRVAIAKVGRGNSGHGVIRATSTLQQERSIHWILASSEL